MTDKKTVIEVTDLVLTANEVREIIEQHYGRGAGHGLNLRGTFRSFTMVGSQKTQHDEYDSSLHLKWVRDVEVGK